MKGVQWKSLFHSDFEEVRKVPTGYTAYIKDGDITTGKDFLKLCLRNFGIAIKSLLQERLRENC